MQPHFIFVTGGVVSGLGKGISTASIGKILQAKGFNVTAMKIDPYLNFDAGTLRPTEHGEVWVTEDGGEIDQDLGHYERFLDVTISKRHNVTTGQVYAAVIERERKGEYLGRTVQPIPHVTDEIKRRILDGADKDVDVAIVEIGGTVGDIESQPFLEALRQLRVELGSHRSLLIHLTLVPYIAAAGETKTKPTQHSVKELRSIGLMPDVLLCRSDHEIDESSLKKIALFTSVEYRAVVPLQDAETIYAIPRCLHEYGLDSFVVEKFRLDCPQPDLSEWDRVVKGLLHPKDSVTVAMVGKYMDLLDAYKSLNEALMHAGIHTDTKVNIRYLDSETLLETGTGVLSDVDAILVPGGFGERGIEGKIQAVRYARENKIPYLGICLGMQVAVIESARHQVGLKTADSTEFNAKTPDPVIALITEWKTEDGAVEKRSENSDLGGTMRLGAQPCKLSPNTQVREIYGADTIIERHRHRYEMNTHYVSGFEKVGLRVSAWSMDGTLPEMVERTDHPWFVACQFHPEFTSTPRDGHPLFTSYIKAAKAFAAHKQPIVLKK
jgi:CTP synthase